MLSSAIVMNDRNMRLLLLALWSVNTRFELPTVFIFKYFINPFMEYLIPIWWPSVSKIVQKHRGTRFSHCSCHCKTVSNSLCLSEGATVTRGVGLTDRSITSILGVKRFSVKKKSNRTILHPRFCMHLHRGSTYCKSDNAYKNNNT